MNWGLYIKKTQEIHPICRNGVEGANKAKDLAVHISLEASTIIQQARRSHTANQPFSTRSVPTSSQVDHAGQVDLPDDLLVVQASSYDNVVVTVNDTVSGMDLLNMPFDYSCRINDVKLAIQRTMGIPAWRISLYHNNDTLENNIVLGEMLEVSSTDTFLFMFAEF